MRDEARGKRKTRDKARGKGVTRDKSKREGSDERQKQEGKERRETKARGEGETGVSTSATKKGCVLSIHRCNIETDKKLFQCISQDQIIAWTQLRGATTSAPLSHRFG